MLELFRSRSPSRPKATLRAKPQHCMLPIDLDTKTQNAQNAWIKRPSFATSNAPTYVTLCERPDQRSGGRASRGCNTLYESLVDRILFRLNGGIGQDITLTNDIQESVLNCQVVLLKICARCRMPIFFSSLGNVTGSVLQG